LWKCPQRALPLGSPYSGVPIGCDMWLFRNNPLKNITDPFAALSVWGSYVRLTV
jgi:hypothetical protein